MRTADIGPIRDRLRQAIWRHKRQADQAAGDYAHLSTRRHMAHVAGLEEALRIVEEQSTLTVHDFEGTDRCQTHPDPDDCPRIRLSPEDDE